MHSRLGQLACDWLRPVVTVTVTVVTVTITAVTVTITAATVTITVVSVTITAGARDQEYLCAVPTIETDAEKIPFDWVMNRLVTCIPEVKLLVTLIHLKQVITL